MEISENSVFFFPPNHPLKIVVFYYKESILGYPYFLETLVFSHDGGTGGGALLIQKHQFPYDVGDDIS